MAATVKLQLSMTDQGIGRIDGWRSEVQRQNLSMVEVRSLRALGGLP